MLLTSGLLVLFTAASAQEPTVLSEDIAAQPLAEALQAFSRQSGLNVVYVSGIVDGQRSQAVAAGLAATAALTRLLEGTGLRFEFLSAHSVRILAAAAGPAAPSDLAEQNATPEVLVTGSRIPVPPNITATSPMQVITAQDIALSGHTDSADVIQALPQMTVSAGADFGNFSSPANSAGGFATADLRGLGPQRTVVLINGRRLGLGDPNTANSAPAPDLDQIPLAMVERVEVLTGGASATYGSDAIAGVVNFILKDQLQGVQIDAQYGFAQHTQQNHYLQGLETDAGIPAPSGTRVDGNKRTLSVLAGTDFAGGNGHVTGYFVYQAQDPVYASARDFSACSAVSTNATTGVPTDGGLTCVLTPQSNLFITQDGAAYSVLGHQFVPWPAAGSVPPARFNPGSYYTLQRDDTRSQAGLLAHWQVSQAARPYLEFSFMDDRTQTQLGPDGIFLGNNPLTPDGSELINCSNPLLSDQQAAILCSPAQIAADRAHPGSVSAAVNIGRRNIEGSGRQTNYQHVNYRVVGGLDGRLGEAWSYNAYALYYETSLHEANYNFFDSAAISNALQVTTDPSGHPVCISGGSCMPYNIFGTGPVTAQQLDYLYRLGTADGTNTEQIFEADVTGQLGRYGWTAPWAHEGVALNLGVEHRAETLRYVPDAFEQTGNLAGQGSPPVAIDQRVSVNEAFMEVRVPVAQDRPALRDLTIGSGYRYSSYSTAGATNTYRFDLQFAPTADARLRISYDRVVRAPNLIELYTPLSYSGSQAIDTDPCAPTDGGATHAVASLAACLHTGVSADQYGNGLGPAVGGSSKIAQCRVGCGVVTGGNLGLRPETADTWSLGITLTPAALPGFTASADYFHIHLTEKIATVPEAVTLQRCLDTGDPTLCSQIVRTPAGSLAGTGVAGGGYILQTSVNTGAALVSGIDVQGNYRVLLGRWGALTGSLNGSWLQHNSATPYHSAPTYDCAGLFGNTCLDGSVNPLWRHNLRLTWETPWSAQLSAQWRFIGSTQFDNNSPQPLLQNQEEQFLDPVLTHVPSYSYLDLAAIWDVRRHFQLSVAVNNVFDKDPPLIPLDVSFKAVNLNTFPTYDILGRTVLLTLRATF